MDGSMFQVVSLLSLRLWQLLVRSTWSRHGEGNVRTA